MCFYYILLFCYFLIFRLVFLLFFSKGTPAWEAGLGIEPGEADGVRRDRLGPLALVEGGVALQTRMRRFGKSPAKTYLYVEPYGSLTQLSTFAEVPGILPDLVGRRLGFSTRLRPVWNSMS